MSSSFQHRRGDISLASDEVMDVIVVGGGINGVGIALDAASRGLQVVLVERDDLGSGTSSRSSKLIHGGLRYLEHLHFGLVREALAERHLISTRLAPHLVRMQRFIAPVYGNSWNVPYYGVGLKLYDLLGGRRDGRSRRMSSAEVKSRVPQIRTEGLHGGYEYVDATVDDARYVIAVARTAAALGARIITRCEASSLVRNRDSVVGVNVRDLMSGDQFDIRARVIIDATGAFSPRWATLLNVAPSRGAHVVLPRSLVDASNGMTFRVPGRVVFLIPWSERWLLGTTDVPHSGPVDRPVATAQEIEYLLSALAAVIDVDITATDLVATFAGIRPLSGSGSSTVSLSREERIVNLEPGLVAVRGGKYTTYRRVAERAVDVASEWIGGAKGSATADLPLKGAEWSTGHQQPSPNEHDTAAHLERRYGSEGRQLARIAAAEDLSRRIIDDLRYLEAEVTWAARHEWALSVDDVMARRTRIAFEAKDHGASAAHRVADLLGEELGWSHARRAREAESYLESSAREYGLPHELAAGVGT